MHEDSKPKIHITPRDNRFPARPNTSFRDKENKDIEECKQEIKKLKKQIAKLLGSAEQEEKFMEECQGKDIVLDLCTGQTDRGKLHKITKFQIIIKRHGSEVLDYYYKSAIVRYTIHD